MRNDVNPFFVPGEDSCPEFVGFVGFEFAFEGAGYGTQGEAEDRAVGGGDGGGAAAHVFDSGGEEGAY